MDILIYVNMECYGMLTKYHVKYRKMLEILECFSEIIQPFTFKKTLESNSLK